MYNIRTNKSWQKNLPQRPRRLMKSYYVRDRQLLYKRVSRIFWLIVIIFLIQGIFQIQYLAISDISLSGNKDLTQEDVQNYIKPILNQSRFIFLKNNNFFLLATGPLADKLKKDFNLEEARVVKKWPRGLSVTIKEKISHFVWQKDGQMYLLDASGAKIRAISAPDPKYLILEDHRSNISAEGALYSTSELDLINKIYLYWQEIIGPQANLYKLVINDGSNWELHASAGYYIILDTGESIEIQLENLDHILKSGNINSGELEYIDLRFSEGGRAYFK